MDGSICFWGVVVLMRGVLGAVKARLSLPPIFSYLSRVFRQG